MRFGLSVLTEVNGAEGLTSAAAGAKENKKEGGYLASDVLGKVQLQHVCGSSNLGVKNGRVGY